MVTALGGHILRFTVYLSGVIGMIAGSLTLAATGSIRGRRATVQVFFRQIYFTGIEALKVVIPLSLIIGAVIVTQIISFAGLDNRAFIGKTLVWVVIRELGPLLTAIIIIARSGAAIATELGNMKLDGEIEALEGMGIPADRYLIMPRVLGVTTAMVFLTVYFELLSITGGFLVAGMGWRLDFREYSRGILSVVTAGELGLSLLKSLLFGLFVAAVCCWQGLGVSQSPTQVPQAATKGVMQSLFFVFILDGLVTAITLAV